MAILSFARVYFGASAGENLAKVCFSKEPPNAGPWEI